LNTFSHQRFKQSSDFYQCPAEPWLKACRSSFLFSPDCPIRLHNPWTSVWTVLIGPVLITCTPPRKKKESSLVIYTKLSMCSLPPRLYSFSR
ncbi:unnamed protein product, partial [Staurois parvus]